MICCSLISHSRRPQNWGSHSSCFFAGSSRLDFGCICRWPHPRGGGDDGVTADGDLGFPPLPGSSWLPEDAAGTREPGDQGPSRATWHSGAKPSAAGTFVASPHPLFPTTLSPRPACRDLSQPVGQQSSLSPLSNISACWIERVVVDHRVCKIKIKGARWREERVDSDPCYPRLRDGAGQPWSGEPGR